MQIWPIMRKTGLSRTTIHRFFNGAGITLHTAIVISDVLDASLDDLN